MMLFVLIVTNPLFLKKHIIVLGNPMVKFSAVAQDANGLFA